MLKTKYTIANDIVRRLKLPLEIERFSNMSDSVYTVCEVIDHIDLSKYFVVKEYQTGRLWIIFLLFNKTYRIKRGDFDGHTKSYTVLQ